MVIGFAWIFESCEWFITSLKYGHKLTPFPLCHTKMAVLLAPLWITMWNWCLLSNRQSQGPNVGASMTYHNIFKSQFWSRSKSIQKILRFLVFFIWSSYQIKISHLFLVILTSLGVITPSDKFIFEQNLSFLFFFGDSVLDFEAQKWE